MTGGGIRRHVNIWAYCDGSRGKNFVCGGAALPGCTPEEFGAGDTVGIEVNWRENRMRIYKNGSLQGELRRLPPGSLTPFVALDDGNDAVEFVRAVRS